LRILVSGVRDTPEGFIKASEGVAAGVTGLLSWRNLHIDDFRAVLDFGCGCGRVIRRFHSVKGTRFYGTDYNPALVKWCQDNLPFAEFGINKLAPPLSYGDGTFGFVYAFSVFTHLPAELQVAWMNELWRVLEPGGYLQITVHGDEYAKAMLSGEQREQFENGQLVVLAEDRAGENLCAAFHPQKYVRSVLTAAGFEVLEFSYGQPFADHIDHDLYLFRKTSV
jgi:SAM-dependent methyltransferase